MSRLRWRLAGSGLVVAVAAALLIAVAREPEPVQAAAEARAFGEKVGLKVTMRSQALKIEYLEQPNLKRIGSREFLGGRRVGSPATVWLPLDEISSIEEYANVEEMQKRNPAAVPKP